MTPEQIIAALGGRARVSELTGAKPNAVSNWYRAGIPAKYWFEIAAEAEKASVQGVTVETLRDASRVKQASAQ